MKTSNDPMTALIIAKERRIRELEDQRRERIATAAMAARLANPAAYYDPMLHELAAEDADKMIAALDGKEKSE